MRTAGVMVSSIAICAVVACGSSATDGANLIILGGAGSDGAAPSPDLSRGDAAPGSACDPPEMLILLDRTLTMGSKPDGQPPQATALQESKLWQAIDAIEAVVAPPMDQRVRFGLSMWPRDPGKDGNGQERCHTVSELIGSWVAQNTPCEGPEHVVAPALGASTAIQNYLDHQRTRLCFSTPTGAALASARAELTAKRTPGREQTVVLVTDGADWDLTCPAPDPRAELAAAASAGIRTFVVGFGAAGSSIQGVGKAFLNEMACAGKTAKDFPNACIPDATYGFRAKAPEGVPLFLLAESGAALSSALDQAAGSVCCNCVR